MLAGLFLVFALIMIPLIGSLVIYLIGLWKLYKKAGFNGWEAIVPFYSSWILIQIAGLNKWYFLVLMSSTICSFVGLGFLSGICSLGVLFTNFLIYYNIGKKFHKDLLFIVLLYLFPFVMIPILGMGKSNVYDSNVIVSEHGPIGEDKVNNNSNCNNYNNSTNNNFCRYCGSKLDNGANFCKSCGCRVNEN